MNKYIEKINSLKNKFNNIKISFKNSESLSYDNYFTYINSSKENKRIENLLSKKFLLPIVSIFVVFLILILFLTNRKTPVEYTVNNILHENNEIVLSLKSDIVEELSLNDIITIEGENFKLTAPIVDNTLFLAINEDYIKINGKNLTIGSKYIKVENKYKTIPNVIKIYINKTNGYKYGDYLTKNNLNKTNIREFENEYEYIKFMTLFNTNIDYCIFNINNNANLSIFKKIFNENSLNSLILLNTNIDDIMSYVRSNSNQSNDPINTVFNNNRILAINSLDYSNLDTLYKSFDRLIKFIYNVDGPFIMTNKIDNDDIVIFNLLINSLQNLSYDEMLNNYLTYYKINFKIENENKILEKNLKKILTNIFNIDEKADFKNLSFKTIINDYLNDIDELTLNYIVNKFSLNLKGEINE